MELHAHLHLIKLSGTCQAETTPSRDGGPWQTPRLPGKTVVRGIVRHLYGLVVKEQIVREQGSRGQLEDGWFMECNKETACCVCMRECTSSSVLGRARSHVRALLVHWCVRLWQIPLARCCEHHFPLLLSAQMFHLHAQWHTHNGHHPTCIPAPAVPEVSVTRWLPLRRQRIRA